MQVCTGGAMSLPSRTINACLLLLALGLVSCTRPPAIPEEALPVAVAEAAGAEPGMVPPATVPHAATALAALSAGYDGYGPVPFGAGPQELRAAWSGSWTATPMRPIRRPATTCSR